MYRTYNLTEEESGKITRQRWDGDTYYYDVFDTQEECDAEEKRLAKIDEEYRKSKEEYLKSLQAKEAIIRTHKYSEMSNTDIRKITYADCPLQCTDCEALCDEMPVGQCRANLSEKFDK